MTSESSQRSFTDRGYEANESKSVTTQSEWKIPNEIPVEDMCLFADVVSNFVDLEDCISNISSWKFNCKCPCPLRNTWDYEQEPKDMMEFQCKNKSLDNVLSFSFKDLCLKESLNKHCWDRHKVPNIIHYVWLGNRHEFQFIHFLSIYSVYKFQKPCVILFHGETIPYGAYWNKTLRVIKNIFHVYRKGPKEIHKRRINYIEHKADVVRLEILWEYGGIYLDTDIVILRSLDALRDFNLSMSRARNDALANFLMLSIKHSKFIDIWLKQYVTFNPNIWSQHSMYLPFNLSNNYPDLIHVENWTFLHGGTMGQIFMSNFKWPHLYAIHLYIRYYKKCPYNEHIIGALNTTMGSVARYVLFGSKDICYKL